MNTALRISGAPMPLVLWYLLADLLGLFSEDLLPTLSAVLQSVHSRARSGALTEDLFATTARWLLGYAAGALAGTCIGFLLGCSSVLKELFSLPIKFLRALPVTNMLPLFLLLFGVGESSKNAMVALPCLLLLAMKPP